VKIQIRLFSILRDRAGTASTELELPAGARVLDAVARLAQEHPRVGPLLSGASPLPVQFAVNREYVQPDQALRAGDELALIPPVSGGARDGRGMLLLSGGFDSPVAAYLVKRSGRELVGVHFTQEPFTDDASARKSAALAQILGIDRLLVVSLGEDLAEFTRRCDHRVYFVLLKRLMVRIAQELAHQEEASFLVTGENLGQVSSQTLPNMGVIDAAATLPILRPLLGFDKEQIIALAKTIGTYETSCGPELCDLLGPRYPATRTTREQIDAEEKKVDLALVIRNALGRVRVVTPASAAPVDANAAACV
jgi:molybdopterin converting factor subunit 1